ncbi:hypothetical protein [Candidatus Fukatsuia endosymbiont of Tuberolachnus salignus]|uniref:hypothetical protein n=1 Tax=Candidatus Fukatsuia endosymbiont of Tuberolachnus salignus TaxID=3077957 RepID=UPI00313DD60E
MSIVFPQNLQVENAPEKVLNRKIDTLWSEIRDFFPSQHLTQTQKNITDILSIEKIARRWLLNEEEIITLSNSIQKLASHIKPEYKDLFDTSFNEEGIFEIKFNDNLGSIITIRITENLNHLAKKSLGENLDKLMLVMPEEHRNKTVYSFSEAADLKIDFSKSSIILEDPNLDLLCITLDDFDLYPEGKTKTTSMLSLNYQRLKEFVADIVIRLKLYYWQIVLGDSINIKNQCNRLKERYPNIKPIEIRYIYLQALQKCSSTRHPLNSENLITISALILYTYEDYNKEIKVGLNAPPEDFVSWKGFFQDLSQGIEQLSRLGGNRGESCSNNLDDSELVLNTMFPGPLFRGSPVRSSRVIFGKSGPPEQFQEGDVLGDRNFFSTSKHEKTAKFFVEDRSTDTTKPEHKEMMYIFGHSGADISAFSTDPCENEVLFKPLTPFTVLFKYFDKKSK